MSQNMRFLCYFFSLQFVSVLFFTLFPSLLWTNKQTDRFTNMYSTSFRSNRFLFRWYTNLEGGTLKLFQNPSGEFCTFSFPLYLHSMEDALVCPQVGELCLSSCDNRDNLSINSANSYMRGQYCSSRFFVPSIFFDAIETAKWRSHSQAPIKYRLIIWIWLFSR